MNKILTIIIPTYNMEKYLRRCLDSLIIDEEGMKQLEVLVINDGSKDSSSQIAHEYQDKYPDTYRVIDKENGNYGSCINSGLKEATGKYVKVLDADDWFDNGNFAKYVVFLNSVDCDMLLTSFNRVDSDGNIIRTTTWELYDNKLFTVDQLPLVNIEMHAITYRTLLLTSMNYRQTEGISYTDTEWSIIPLQNVNTCLTYPLNIYQYLEGREGQTMQEGVFAKNFKQSLLICENILSKYDFSKSDNKADLYVKYKYMMFLEGVYRAAIIDNFGKDIYVLAEFDNLLKIKNNEMHEKLGNTTLSNKVHIKFIRLWRNRHYSNKIFILGLFVSYKKFKRYFKLR